MPKSFDLINRDPHKMNAYVRVLYEQVIAEPDESSYSVRCVWENSYLCYRFGKNCCYNFLSYILSIPTSLCWGCAFGITAFYHVWLFVPMLRFQNILFHMIRGFMKLFLAVFLAPIFETYGLVFSRIHVEKVNGEPPRPFMVRLHTSDFDKKRFVGGGGGPATKPTTNQFAAAKAAANTTTTQNKPIYTNKVAPVKKNPPPTNAPPLTRSLK